MEIAVDAGPFVAMGLLLASLGGPRCVRQEPADATIVLEGRVVDLRGEPVPAARIDVVAEADRERTSTRTIADGDGCFRVGRMAAHAWLLVSAKADGHCTGVTRCRPDQGRVSVLVHHATTVCGRLLDQNGDPVAGVTVRAVSTADVLFTVDSDAVTEADGTFRLQHVPLAPIEVSAWVPGEGLASHRTTATGPLELTLRPDGMPTTRLAVTIDGLDAADTTTELQPWTYTQGRVGRLPPPQDRPIVRKGTWSLDLAPDRDYTVLLSSPEWAFSPPWLAAKATKGPHSLRARATRIGSVALDLHATVRGPDNRPVAGVPFVLHGTDHGQEARATSDADGNLTFASPIAEGLTGELRTVHPDWTAHQTRVGGPLHGHEREYSDMHLFQIDGEQTIELQVVPACKVTGRLLHADHRPAAFVHVSLEHELVGNRPYWMDFAHATSDRAGRVTFHGLHDIGVEVRLVVEDTAGSFCSEPFPLTRPGARADLGDLVLDPPAVVEGIVRDPSRNPAAGVQVWLRFRDLTEGKTSWRETASLTDRDGRYRFLGVPPGRAWLEILASSDPRAARDKAMEPFAVEPGRTYTHELTVTTK